MCSRNRRDRKQEEIHQVTQVKSEEFINGVQSEIAQFVADARCPDRSMLNMSSTKGCPEKESVHPEKVKQVVKEVDEESKRDKIVDVPGVRKRRVPTCQTAQKH